MAEHITKHYSCDRCKTSIGAERPQRPQCAEVTACFNWREGPGPTFKWNDLCDGCYQDVMRFFEPNEWSRKSTALLAESRRAVSASTTEGSRG